MASLLLLNYHAVLAFFNQLLCLGLVPIEPLLSELERSVRDAGEERKLMSGMFSIADGSLCMYHCIGFC